MPPHRLSPLRCIFSPSHRHLLTAITPIVRQSATVCASRDRPRPLSVSQLVMARRMGRIACGAGAESGVPPRRATRKHTNLRASSFWAGSFSAGTVISTGSVAGGRSRSLVSCDRRLSLTATKTAQRRRRSAGVRLPPLRRPRHRASNQLIACEGRAGGAGGALSRQGITGRAVKDRTQIARTEGHKSLPCNSSALGRRSKRLWRRDSSSSSSAVRRSSR